MPGTKPSLQQQPTRLSNKQQQQTSGSSEFQPRHAQHDAEAPVNEAGDAEVKGRTDGRHNS